MKYHKKCFPTIIVLLSVLLLSSGCHTGRLSKKRRIQRSSVLTQTITRSDSISLSQQLQATCQQKLRLEHIELFPPDSLQRQYIRSVTRLEGDKETDGLSVISGKINKEEDISVNKEKVVTSKVTKVLSSFWWGGIVLLVVGWILVNKKVYFHK
nr:hypothetical protein [Parabacteroides goldsteinii]